MAIAIGFTVNSAGELVLAKGTGNDVIVGATPSGRCSVNSQQQILVNTSNIVPTRKKVEVTLNFSPSLVLSSGVNYNLINIIKATIPTSGTFLPFFNTTSNELNAYNDDASLNFKLNLVGSWSGGSSNRSIQVDFVGTTGNRIVESRDSAVTSDILTFTNLFSIDKNGNIATNGTAVTIQSNGGNFTATQMLLIAEQVTLVDEILTQP
jgi:hypothetical protein